MFQLGNDFAAFFACVELERHLLLPLAAGGALFSQFFQAAHTPFVAGAARFYALAYPCFLLRVKFVKQAVVFGFYGEFLRFFLAVFGEAAVIGAQRAAV